MGAWQQGARRYMLHFIFYFTFICVFYFIFIIFFIQAERVFFYIYFYLPRRASVNQERGAAGGGARQRSMWRGGCRVSRKTFFPLGNSQLEKVEATIAVAIDSVCVEGGGAVRGGVAVWDGGREQANCCQYVCNANKLYLIKGTRVTDTPRPALYNVLKRFLLAVASPLPLCCLSATTFSSCELLCIDDALEMPFDVLIEARFLPRPPFRHFAFANSTYSQ